MNSKMHLKMQLKIPLKMRLKMPYQNGVKIPLNMELICSWGSWILCVEMGKNEKSVITSLLGLVEPSKYDFWKVQK